MLNLKLFIAIITMIAVALVILFLTIKKPTEIDWVLEIQKATSGMFPQDTISCGFVALGDDRYASNSCVADAETRQQSYWIAAELFTDDSSLWAVYYKKPDGSAEEILFESDGSGMPLPPLRAIDRRICLHVLFAAKLQNEEQKHTEPTYSCL